MNTTTNNFRANTKTANNEENQCWWIKYNYGTKNDFSTVPKVGGTFNVTAYENLLKVEYSDSYYPTPNPPERKENDIKTFSSQSRKRLFELFNSLEYSSYGKPVFVSATWHYDSPDNRSSLKNLLANYIHALKRQLPPFHSIWKLEYQQRGIPHFHFMILPLDKTTDFDSSVISTIIKNNWLKRKQCNCVHCKNYSIKTVSVKDYKHAMIYISKEIAKVQDRYEDHDLGRIWGSSRNMRVKVYGNYKITTDEFEKIVSIKLKEDFVNESSKLYLMSLKQMYRNCDIFININEVKSFLDNCKFALPNKIKLNRPPRLKLLPYKQANTGT